MRRLLLAVLIALATCASGSLVFAQSGGGGQQTQVTGTLNFALNALPYVPQIQASTCTYVISGTWSGTIALQGSSDGGLSWTTLGTPQTANGTTVVGCAGYRNFQLLMTTYTSGAANVLLTASSAGAGGTGGGGGSGGTVAVSPLPLPVNVQNTPGVVVANSSANPVPVAPPTGTYLIAATSPIPNVAVNGTNTPVTLSTACGTPTTPTSCATTSYALFDLGQQGSSDYSYQVNTISGATLAFYSSNDGVNFFASNLTIAGTSPSALNFATSTTVAGKFGGIGGGSRYAAIVVTVAPTSAITVIPYLGSHASSVAIHGSVPLTIANTAAPYVPNSVNPLGTPAPQNLDAQGNLLTTIAAPNNSGTSSPLKTTNSITGGAGSTLGLLGVGLCSGASSAPYCAAVNASSQLAVSNPYAGTVNQALQVSSFQGFGCVSSALPGTLVTGDFQPCFEDPNGNLYVTSTPAFNGGSGTIIAASGAVIVPTQGYGSVGITVSGTFTGTLAFQASSDGGLTYPVTVTMQNVVATGTASTITAPGSYRANIAPYDHFRVYATAFTSGTATVNYALGSTSFAPTISPLGVQSAAICSSNSTNVCVNPGTLSAGGNSLGSTIGTQSNTLLYNGSTLDLARKDTYTAGPQWVTPGGSTNLGIAVGVAGPTVVKSSAGRIVQFLVTTAGTTSETFYDNASACSGTIIGITPATTSVGSVYAWNYTAVNGITACGAASTSPAGTIAYF